MNRKLNNLALLLSLASFAGATSADYSRAYIHIVGSSTVFPYAKAVGEKLEKSKKIKFPRLESTGTGGGIKLFCEGVGSDYPDIANASRQMKPKERDECQANGVNDIVELKIGYDGLVLAQSGKAAPLALTRKETRLALAKWVPDSAGKLALNPNKTWKDINPSLPASPIEILGPPAASGTYDALVDLISESACNTPPWVAPGKTEPTPDMQRKCHGIREDGVYTEGRENDEDIVFRLLDSPDKVAIFSYSLLASNDGKLRAIPIDGVAPSESSISTQQYPVSRPLFMDVKTAHLDRIPGLKAFLAELVNEKAWGEKGYLKSRGLITMPANERLAEASEIKALGIPVADQAPARKSAKSTQPEKKGARTGGHHTAKKHS